MAFVNYVRESMAFIEYASANSVSANERLLWYAVFHVMNQHANGSDWPTDFVAIPNKQILFFLPFGEDSLTNARNRLKQRGLIDYVPGKKNKEAPKYKMNYFFAELSTGYQQFSESYPIFSGNKYGNTGGNIRGNIGGNIRGNLGGNIGGKTYDININLNDNVNPNVNQNVYGEDDDGDGTRARAYARDERFAEEERARATTRDVIVEAYRREFGKDATVAEVNRLAAFAVAISQPPEMVEEALRVAAENHANSPAMYAKTLLRDWAEEYIFCQKDLGEYQLLRDIKADRVGGEFGVMSSEQIIRDMNEARKRRMNKYAAGQ